MAKRQDVIIKEDDRELVIPKYKQKTMLDHFMILLGVVSAILIFLVVFDILYEVSFFGYLFSRDEWRHAAAVFRGEGAWSNFTPDGLVEGTTYPLYDDGLKLRGFWMPTFLFTVFFIAAAVGVVWLITYYVRDYVEVVRGLFRGIIDLKKGVTGSVKEAFSDFEKTEVRVKKSNIVEGKDSTFINEIDREKKLREKKAKKEAEAAGRDPSRDAALEVAVPPKRGPGRPRKNPVSDLTGEPRRKVESEKVEGVSDAAPQIDPNELLGLSSDELDALLTNPSGAVNENGQIKEEEDLDYKPKSLFSDKE